jgi:flavin-dependent thymidylate synthase
MSENHTLMPLGDAVGYITLLDWMGDDAEIIRRARVCYHSAGRSTPGTDRKLLRQLVGDGDKQLMHGTVFRGVVFTFDVVLPLFTMRQYVRHLVGHDYFGQDVWAVGQGDVALAGAFDEMSFRHVDGGGGPFYLPPRQRLPKVEDVSLWTDATRKAVAEYEGLLEAGYPKELARCFLPASVYTQMTWTTNLQALLDFIAKRLPGTGAQWEIQQYALAALELARRVVPQTIATWEERHEKA